MPRKIGVIAIQGDYAKHLEALQRCGVPGIEPVEVRTPEELALVERAILPGGESTTVGLLMERFGLGDALCARAAEGMPLWGTCMGLILLAKAVEGRDQYQLGLLDVTVRRNAFGAQVHSFEDRLAVDGIEGEVTAVFIRAPIIVSCGPGVQPTATYQGQIVAARQGSIVGTSFHPELTDDTRLHRWFCEL